MSHWFLAFLHNMGAKVQMSLFHTHFKDICFLSACLPVCLSLSHSLSPAMETELCVPRRWEILVMERLLISRSVPIQGSQPGELSVQNIHMRLRVNEKLTFLMVEC